MEEKWCALTVGGVGEVALHGPFDSLWDAKGYAEEVSGMDYYTVRMVQEVVRTLFTLEWGNLQWET
jgi:hypothetical protein